MKNEGWSLISVWILARLPVAGAACFRLFITHQKLLNALKSPKSKKSLQESTNRASERASECHSPHRIYNSLLRMRAIHELKMSSNLWLRYSVLILTSHWLVLMLEFVNISSCDYFRFRFSTVCPKLLQWLCAPALINMCHSPVGRSVFGKTVPSVLSTTRDRGHSFAQFGPTSAGE